MAKRVGRKRSRIIAFFFFFVFQEFIFSLGLAVPQIVWPTPDERFFNTGNLEALLQPTASGKLESARFGCVRNDGHRFHEGLDIKPKKRDKLGEASDPIFSAMAGRVTYINKIAGNSSYGRYVVVVHEDADVPVYTLYAHLARIRKSLRVGAWVETGAELGIMGRSAGGYSIPKSRAHLHFEIGLLKSKSFDKWYQKKRISGKNHHGIYNGMNLWGMNPERFYRAVLRGDFHGFASYIQNLDTGFVLRVSTREIPDFVVRYPKLLTGPVKAGELVGWQIEYTAYGMPKSWTPLNRSDVPTSKRGDVGIVAFDSEVMGRNCRECIEASSDGTYKIGKTFANDLKLVFGFN